LKFRVTVLLQL